MQEIDFIYRIELLIVSQQEFRQLGVCKYAL